MGNKKKKSVKFQNNGNSKAEKVEKSSQENSSKMWSNARKKQLLEANKEEDKTIKRLEKLLKLNKKKSKKLPSNFMDDGLDYLLDFIDKKDDSRILSDGSDDLESDLAAVQGNSAVSSKKRKKPESKSALNTKKQRTLSELLKEKNCMEESEPSSNDDESGADFSDEDFESDDAQSTEEKNSDKEEAVDDSEEDESLSESKAESEKKPKIWQDIYGRFRDESGNIANNNDSQQTYVPPKLRKENEIYDSNKQEELQKIRRQLKGFLNRLSESNMVPISRDIEKMFTKHSRNDLKETLFSLMSELVLGTTLTPSRLIMEQAMLIALLHAKIGSEVGAFFLQHLVEKIDALFKASEDYGIGKECNNILIFLSHLYNFEVTHCTLIFDIFSKLIESFKSKDIELIQLLLKNSGFILRKDDALKLKEVISAIQAKAASAKEDQNDTRIKFMLDTLTAIRNNNMNKIPDYDPSVIDHSKKLLRALTKDCSLQNLQIPFKDLLKADERGRWWVVGSAWLEREKPTESQNNLLPKTQVSEKILELAQKQHMNTEIRKSVFCVIMTAEDFMDAFEKLLKLNLKNQQKREIINVILHCALSEQKFNPFYAYLAGKFCNFHREFQMMLQFSLWDKFKELSKLNAQQLNNLSHFLSHLFTSGELPISVLKVIHFSEMDKTMVRFFRQILLAILLHDSEEVCCTVFKRIAPAKNLNLLRESLRLFMHHFLLRNRSKFEPEVAEKISERIKLAENALNSAKRAFKL